mmetsp:Transcript_127597/g.367120  ORF Transcript_127597/g.367120 Transcript_127597/m.367120 type:complete len:221 (-) Transcript_127597:1643-2305(-)
MDTLPNVSQPWRLLRSMSPSKEGRSSLPLLPPPPPPMPKVAPLSRRQRRRGCWPCLSLVLLLPLLPPCTSITKFGACCGCRCCFMRRRPSAKLRGPRSLGAGCDGAEGCRAPSLFSVGRSSSCDGLMSGSPSMSSCSELGLPPFGGRRAGRRGCVEDDGDASDSSANCDSEEASWPPRCTIQRRAPKPGFPGGRCGCAGDGLEPAPPARRWPMPPGAVLR